jgi:hypothetical protein
MNASSQVKAFIALLMLSSLAFAQSAMLVSLQDYYKHSKSENIDAYFGVMDLSEFSQQEVQLKRELVATLWERFDTLDYTLSNASEYAEDDFGIIEYHLSARIRGPDGSGGQGEFSYEDDFVATMRQVDGSWKVNNVQQADVFAANMENFFLDTQTDVIGEINEKALETIEAQPPGSAGTITTQTGTNEEETPTTKPTVCLGGFLIAGTGLMAYLSGRKRKGE